ncbi:MAG: glutamine--fructose-6-phosphate transaminase (isomerizing) [Deltaproteobacteria bacterium]|nr:glutamine--fructose-6-phosphate transaminase (isomerizing) [Deltaproteobacteria bacterium]
MCGIIGYVGSRDCAPLILEGLKRLEYRGYDSAGIAVFDGTRLKITRSVGKLANLEKALREKPLSGTVGIGHTRWATHGKPSEQNAHPHEVNGIAVIHNGIIENYVDLKAELSAAGSVFKSETDTEVIAHLVDQEAGRGKGLFEAVCAALRRVRGAYAIVVVSEREPGKLVAAKNASPMIVGIGDDERFIASDVPAILPYTRQVMYMYEEEVAEVTARTVRVTDLHGAEKTREVRVVDATPAMAEKGGHRHFMHKEIFEQPRALMDTIRGRLSADRKTPLDGEMPGLSVPGAVKIIACGTSWHAALIGKFMIEELARVPVEVDLASEFRYRDPIVGKGELVVAISQSGETADTLAALREARSKGAHALAICNVVDSSIAREADTVLYTRAGPEIGVASTKAFVTQMAVLFLFAVRLGLVSGRLDPARAQALVREFTHIPSLMEEVLRLEQKVQDLAREFMHASDFLYLGRGINYPVALEGALKLKEISYIHAEGYPAGEMKHGPIALIDEEMPVLVVATRGRSYEKVLSNVQEAKARGGRIIALVTWGDARTREIADRVLEIPDVHDLLQPFLTSVSLQLLAYHIADLKGNDVDQPRNLAKSVTVE